MTRVVLAKSKIQNYAETDIADTVERALDKLDFDFGNRIRTIVIKPNLCYYWNYSTGETTDPRVVSSIIDCVRRKLGNDVDISVAEADASAMKTKFAFTILEYDKMCQARNVKLINLSEGKIRDVSIRVVEKDFALPINEILLNADLVINVPKLKTHNFVGATCSLKNIFGAISKPRKYSYHKMINHVIVGMNKMVKSHIIIVDGLVVKGSYPKKMGVILAGDDALATDFTAARIMGFSPKRVAHLNLAEKEGIGQARNIELVEEVKLSELKKEFPTYHHFRHSLSWSLQLKLLRRYAKVVGDVLPPFVEN